MRWLLALLLSCSSLSYAAESQFYGEAQLGLHGVQHSDIDFYPGFASGSVGLYVLPRIGIEVFYDRVIADDREQDFEVEVNESSGAAIRLESPPLHGLQAYVLLGYVTFSVHQFEIGESSRRLDKEDFSGARVSIGLAQSFKRNRNVQFVVEYRNYDVDSPLNVDGLGLGLRVKLK